MGQTLMRPGESGWSYFRRAMWDLTKELAPTMLLILGVCFMGLGGIMHSEGVHNRSYDDHLRSVGAETVGKVVEVERYHSSRPRGGGATYYTPITLQTVAGKEYRTRLDVYEVANDSRFYYKGQELPILYDPSDPKVAGVKLSEFPERFESNITRSGSFFWPGFIAFLIGVPTGIVQFCFYVRGRWRTRKDRGWRKLRYEIKYRRPRKLRKAERRAKAKLKGRGGRHSR